MPVQKVINKRYDDFGGLDLRSGDILRNPSRASDMLNAMRLRTGTLTARWGGKVVCGNSGGLGLHEYVSVDSSTGNSSSEILTCGAKLYRRKDSTLTINYGGSSSNVSFSVYVDTDDLVWKAKLTVDSVTELDYNLKVGFDEASIVDIDTLRAAINSEPDFTASLSGATTVPAAFLPMLNMEPVGSQLVVTFYEWEEVNHPTSATNPFAGSVTNRADAGFENVSAVNMDNSIYFGNGYNEIVKYDGVDCYRAGMPEGDTPSVATGAAGSLTGSYTYKALYEQRDAKGKIRQGIISVASSSVAPSSETVDVTIDNIAASSGFNTDCAVVAGAQSGVTTITVDDGSGGSHTMKVGQTAYFYDGSSSAYVEREITAVAAGTITIAGAAVNVADNAVISNNLRIKIYRTKASGSLHYLVATIPNNSFASNSTYNDNTTDANLGAVFIDPTVAPGLPPKGKYVCAHQGLLCVAGNFENPDVVYFSNALNPEGFGSTDDEEIRVVNEDGITSIASNAGLLVVFKERSTHFITGELATLQYFEQLVSTDVGCVAHATVKDIKGTLFFLSERGVYTITGGQLGPEISDPIRPLLIRRDLPATRLFAKKRATAVHDPDNEHYILFLPTEDTTGAELHPTTDSVCFVFDYFRNEWLKWQSLNMAGGAVYTNGELFWQERRYSTYDSNMAYRLHRRHQTGTNLDYKDHNAAIVWSYTPGWEALGEPSLAKKFTRFKLFSSDPLRSGSFAVRVRTEHNYSSGTHSEFDIAIGSGGSGLGWGLSGWGGFPWGYPTEPFKKIRLKPARALSQRYIFDHSTIDAAPLITAWETEIVTSYQPGLKDG